MEKLKQPYYRQFMQQRANAKTRGIEWQFTYDEWIEWWGEDITKRGKGGDCLAMLRENDEGPYCADNCRKGTQRENALELHSYKVHTQKELDNLRVRDKRISTPYGEFPSMRAAELHCKDIGVPSSARFFCLSNLEMHKDWYFLDD